jgi:hypothetical protein
LLHLPGFLVHRIKKLMKYTDNWWCAFVQNTHTSLL